MHKNWKPNKPHRTWRRKKDRKVSTLRRKYGPQWWKADPTIKKEKEILQ